MTGATMPAPSRHNATMTLDASRAMESVLSAALRTILARPVPPSAEEIAWALLPTIREMVSRVAGEETQKAIVVLREETLRAQRTTELLVDLLASVRQVIHEAIEPPVDGAPPELIDSLRMVVSQRDAVLAALHKDYEPSPRIRRIPKPVHLYPEGFTSVVERGDGVVTLHYTDGTIRVRHRCAVVDGHQLVVAPVLPAGDGAEIACPDCGLEGRLLDGRWVS